jgi:membrane-bound ClpP family serine protease
MNVEILVPIALFGFVALSIKFIVDGLTRRRLASSGVSDELVRSMLEADLRATRLSSHKWGFVLIALGAGLVLIEILDIEFESAGAMGLLMLAAGAGLLGHFFVYGKQISESGP